MTTIVLPPLPRTVPTLDADPDGVAAQAVELLAASAQVDDVGSFAAGEARVDGWQGTTAASYHAGLPPYGRQADAMSLALRHVGRRTDEHADVLRDLEVRRTAAEAERAELVAKIRDLSERVNALLVRTRGVELTPEAADAAEAAAVALAEEAGRLTRWVQVFDLGIDTWHRDLHAEEAAYTAELARVQDLEQVDRLYGGVEDPADAALASMPPPGSDPEEVADWWAGLSTAEQQAILAASPGSVGNLDGVPPSVRDEANRLRLTRDLAALRELDDDQLTDTERAMLRNAEAAESALADERTDPVTGDPVPASLLVYDPTAFDGDGAAAVAYGDLATADHTGVVVPGITNTGASIDGFHDDAWALYESTRGAVGADESVATVAWIGYDAPSDSDMVNVRDEGAAARGAERLASTIDGLRATYTGPGETHLTTIGHSYGSTTVGIAAEDHHIDTDELVFLGSPGDGGDDHDAGDYVNTDRENVWAGKDSRDPVAVLGEGGASLPFQLGPFGLGPPGLGILPNVDPLDVLPNPTNPLGPLQQGPVDQFIDKINPIDDLWEDHDPRDDLPGLYPDSEGQLGTDPTSEAFGAQRFGAERSEGSSNPLDHHTSYFDEGSESLDNLGLITGGRGDDVERVPHSDTGWLGDAFDPELFR
ncbi:alpha/beta hydrolase [Nocardioides sp. CPCC 205120]|uniref:alpha/beta hydrolase n=1 Tax=Nocardioides sp. CPCC 205120 TaxID=3406462 RepID=UPI003B510BFA